LTHQSHTRVRYFNSTLFLHLLAAIGTNLEHGLRVYLVFYWPKTRHYYYGSLCSYPKVPPFVTASPNSAAICCPPKHFVIDLCYPSPNRSTIICIPNSVLDIFESLLLFLLSPLAPLFIGNSSSPGLFSKCSMYCETSSSLTIGRFILWSFWLGSCFRWGC